MLVENIAQVIGNSPGSRPGEVADTECQPRRPESQSPYTDTGETGTPAAQTETPAAAVPQVASGDQRDGSAAGASVVGFRDVDAPSRYVPGVVTRPFTSEPAPASGAESSARVPRSSSVAFLASSVALA